MKKLCQNCQAPLAAGATGELCPACLVKAGLRTEIPAGEGSTPPGGLTELKMKWTLGARLVREEEIKQAMEIHTPGRAEPLKHDLSLNLGFALTVVNEHPDDCHEIELEFLSARMGMTTGSYQWLYDSTMKSGAEVSAPGELFSKIVGSKIRYFMNATHEIERMEGADELVKRLNFGAGATLKPGMTWDKKELDALVSRLTFGAQRPDTFAGLRSMFSKAFFRQLARRNVYLPTTAVRPGDTWPVADEYSIDIWRTLVRDFTVSFQGWETHGNSLCARLEFRGTEKTRPESVSKQVASIKPNLEGTFSGVAWFDPQLGAMIETNMSRDFGVTTNKPVKPTPYAAGPIQSSTDRHHQVLIEKLVSVEPLANPKTLQP